MNDAVGRLLDTVKRLRPRSKETHASLTPIYRRVSQYPAQAVLEVLEADAGENPGHWEPQWKWIYAQLRTSRSEEYHADTDPLASHLKSLRYMQRKDRVKGADKKTDFDMWLDWVEAQTFPVTHHTVTRRPHDDPDGRRRKAAEKIRERERDYWICEQKQAGATIPAWLQGEPVAV
jgi:hypothetical protein